MKKITFILFALIAGTGFAQTNVASAVVNAKIVNPISIVPVASSVLEFGQLAAPSVDTDVIVSTAGNRTNVTDVTIPGTITPTEAQFEITAASAYTYTIVLAATPLSGGGGDNMPLSLEASFSDFVPATTGTGTGSAQILHVGGTLTVNGSQGAGTYAGEAEVTVAYN